MKDLQDKIVIKCPHCGREYLPAEIYLPDSLLGKPSPNDIIRNPLGEIDFYLGDEPDLEEVYVCDNCHTKFRVVASMNFKTYDLANYNFDTDHTTKLEVNNKVQLF